jgi:hercynine metabolism protein
MAGAGNWLDQLEARLDQTLGDFLRANPQQDALLAEQAARERQQQLRRDRLALRTEAELQRQGLLRLAEDIRGWQKRVERAKQAGAMDLAGRAEAHIGQLMEQGRARWQTLGELGDRFAAVEQELQQLARGAAGGTTGQGARGPEPAGVPQKAAKPSLDAEWAAFETEQELETLRRNLQR